MQLWQEQLLPLYVLIIKRMAQDFVEANAAYFNNSASGGTVTNLTSSKAALSLGILQEMQIQVATAPVTFTTGKDGMQPFNGLNLVDNNTDGSNTTNYYLVEVAAPTGYQLP